MTFDKDIPIPPRGYTGWGGRRAVLDAMEVGDSFFIETETDRRGFAGQASTMSAMGEGKWIVRKWETGWRCWRLAKEIDAR